MATELFSEFSADEKREVSQALDRVAAIRDAYATAVSLGQLANGADLIGSNDPLVQKEVGEAQAAARSSQTSLMAELTDYSQAFSMTPKARAGASAFVNMLDRARIGDRAAIATVQSARNELGEASRARADIGTDPKLQPRQQTPTVGEGDGPGLLGKLFGRDRERGATDDQSRQADPATVEVVAKPGSRVNTLALPESFVDRYLRAGDSLVDARSPARLILVDRGKRLDAPREYSSETITAMVDIAEARGWSQLAVKGDKEFKAAVYAQAASRGMAVSGYRPSEAEKAVAERNANRHAERATQSQTRRGRASASERMQEGHANAAPKGTLAEAFKHARTPAEQKAATEKYPQLAKAFAMEAVASNKARSLDAGPARTAFMDRFRDTIAFDLAQGREMADIRLRKPMFRDQRDQARAADRGR